jgi:endonuclease/exonuclease/phosphatase family metal-dependent hydrolase
MGHVPNQTSQPMKIITLNTWGGRAGKEELIDFFRVNKDVDVFCLQEMWSMEKEYVYTGVVAATKFDINTIATDGVTRLENLLSEHDSYFHPHFHEHYGLHTLINKKFQVNKIQDVFVYKYKGYAPDKQEDAGNCARNIQHAEIVYKNEKLNIINFHGLWNGQGKGDSEDRIKQSENIINFLKELEGKIILCGDFNLRPDTKSLQMFEEFGLRNLVKEYGITSTRTSHYKKPEKFADYIFVSDGVEVKDFKVMPDEVSDHAPLYLEIE